MGFYVNTNADDNELKMLRGGLKFRANPRLARSYSNGVCSIPTPNIRISDIEYSEAHLNVLSGGWDFIVPVETSKFWAVNGVHGDKQNAIGGNIRVWGHEQTFDESDGLDPNYSKSGFVASFDCTDDIAHPFLSRVKASNRFWLKEQVD